MKLPILLLSVAITTGTFAQLTTGYLPKTNANVSITGLGNSSIFQSGTNIGVGTATPNAKLDLIGTLRMNDNDIYIRGGTDVNHGLGFYDNIGGSKVFANTSINGPVLFGYGGGALGTSWFGQNIALKWNTAGLITISGGTTIAGNVGIGTTAPTQKLSVVGNAAITGNTTISGTLAVGPTAPNSYGSVIIRNQAGQPFSLNLTSDVNNGWANQLIFSNASGARHLITDDGTSGSLLFHPGLGNGAVGISRFDGQVVIGNGQKPITATFTPFALAVSGTIVSQKIMVETTDWADRVFDETYKLDSLSTVENFIKKNKHLPLIPSQKEVTEKGIDVAEMNKLLLQKVEELTLYVINQQKEIEMLKNKKCKL